MIKYIGLIVILISQTLAFDKNIIMAKQVENIIKVKMLIKDDFMNPQIWENYKQGKENAYFIRNITAYINGDTVYNISLSPQFKQRGLIILKFNFKYIGRGDKLEVVVTDNKGKRTYLNTKIKNSMGKNNILSSSKSTLKEQDYWLIKPKLWELTNTEKAIQELYETKKPKVADINISISHYAGMDFTPIHISSNIRMKSIAVFADDLRNSSYTERIPSIRAVISIPKGTSIIYGNSFSILTVGSLYYLPSNSCPEDVYVPITVVGIDKDEKIHKGVLKVKLYISGDCEM